MMRPRDFSSVLDVNDLGRSWPITQKPSKFRVIRNEEKKMSIKSSPILCGEVRYTLTSTRYLALWPYSFTAGTKHNCKIHNKSRFIALSTRVTWITRIKTGIHKPSIITEHLQLPWTILNLTLIYESSQPFILLTNALHAAKQSINLFTSLFTPHKFRTPSFLTRSILLKLRTKPIKLKVKYWMIEVLFIICWQERF